MNDPALSDLPPPRPDSTSNIIRLRVNDVLMGRGVNISYEGNIRFRCLVHSQKATYVAMSHHRQKHSIAEYIYDKICLQRHGRFLVRRQVAGNAVHWEVVPKERAMEKIKQALREKNRATPTASPFAASHTLVGISRAMQYAPDMMVGVQGGFESSSTSSQSAMALRMHEPSLMRPQQYITHRLQMRELVAAQALRMIPPMVHDDLSGPIFVDVNEQGAVNSLNDMALNTINRLDHQEH